MGADADAASTAEKKPEPPNCTETSPGKHVGVYDFQTVHVYGKADAFSPYVYLLSYQTNVISADLARSNFPTKLSGGHLWGN